MWRPILRSAAFASLYLLSGQGQPCCVVSEGSPVLMTQENALIVWDEKSRTEHFVRQVDFDAKARTFGFIVPTKSVPELALVDSKIMNSVNRFVSKQMRPKISMSCSADHMPLQKSVEILKTELLGDYKATVVKATDGASLDRWLKSNGFVSRPAMVPWLDYYAARGWVFTALKYNGTLGKPTVTHAIRLSYKTDKPYFPWKMPSDTFAPGWIRTVNIAVISATPMKGRMSDGSAWDGKVQWSGDCGAAAKVWCDQLGLPEGSLGPAPVLTSFVNGRNEKGFDLDLSFEPDPKPNWIPIGLGALAVFVARRVMRRRRAVAP